VPTSTAATSPGGRVAIDWTVSRTSLGLTLNLQWKETGGDAPKRNPRNGFGLRIVKMAIERQLNGQVEQTFDRDGVAVRLTVPLTQERWSQFGTTSAGEPQQESAAQRRRMNNKGSTKTSRGARRSGHPPGLATRRLPRYALAQTAEQPDDEDDRRRNSISATTDHVPLCFFFR
jgi:hypothetical protein